MRRGEGQPNREAGVGGCGQGRFGECKPRVADMRRPPRFQGPGAEPGQALSSLGMVDEVIIFGRCHRRESIGEHQEPFQVRARSGLIIEMIETGLSATVAFVHRALLPPTGPGLYVEHGLAEFSVCGMRRLPAT